MTPGPGRRETPGRLRIAVVDSGINPAHRQVGPVAGGVWIGRAAPGAPAQVRILGEHHPADWADRIGHGTAVAAAVSEDLPPERFELLSVRVFARRLDAPPACLAAGIEWGLQRGAKLLNLSAGVPVGSDPEGEARLRTAAERVSAAGALLIAPAASRGTPLVPGCLADLPGLLGVEAEKDLERGEFRRRGDVLAAAPWARPLPPLPRERNHSGVSFAVALVTNRLALLLLDSPETPVANLPERLVQPRQIAARQRERSMRDPSGPDLADVHIRERARPS